MLETHEIWLHDAVFHLQHLVVCSNVNVIRYRNLTRFLNVSSYRIMAISSFVLDICKVCDRFKLFRLYRENSHQDLVTNYQILTDMKLYSFTKYTCFISCERYADVSPSSFKHLCYSYM